MLYPIFILDHSDDDGLPTKSSYLKPLSSRSLFMTLKTFVKQF